MAVMPMFPLSSVLLPGAVLPLHVFEPRYRQMMRDCLDTDDHEFGVVLIERGGEVGGGDTRTMIGTVARMLQVAELDDGRYAVITVGTRRIRVTSWMPDDPYPRAHVEDWPEAAGDDPALGTKVESVAGRVRRVNALAAELGHTNADAISDVGDDPLVASYHLSALAPVGPADRQRLLAAAGPGERLELLETVLDDVEAVLNFRLQHPGEAASAPPDVDLP